MLTCILCMPHQKEFESYMDGSSYNTQISLTRQGRRRSSLQTSEAVERTALAFKEKFPAIRTLLCTPDRDECGVFRVPSHL